MVRTRGESNAGPRGVTPPVQESNVGPRGVAENFSPRTLLHSPLFVSGVMPPVQGAGYPFLVQSKDPEGFRRLPEAGGGWVPDERAD